MRRTLNLDEDFRDRDALHALQDSFGQTFEPAETVAWRTVGDVEDAVVARIASREAQGEACLSSIGFYRLRQLLEATGSPPRIAPSQRVRDVTKLSPRKLCAALTAAGLAPPSYRSVQIIAAGFLVAASLAVIVIGLLNASIVGVLIGVLGLASSGLAVASAQGRYARRLTVGDVALMVVDLNVARLAAQGGRVDERTTRRAVRRLLAEAAECDMRAVTRNTLLVT